MVGITKFIGEKILKNTYSDALPEHYQEFCVLKIQKNTL